MNQIHDGDPVSTLIARGHVETPAGSGHENLWLKFSGGVSLRDQFAMAALNTLVNAKLFSPSGYFTEDGEHISAEEHLALRAFAFADAMLRAREAK